MPRPALRWLLGLLLLAAGLSKLALQPAELAHRLGQFALFGPLTLNWLAISLPWAEILAGAGLLRRWPGSQCLAVGLCTGFTGVVGWALARGLRVDCGCFGPAVSLVGWPHLVADLSLCLVALSVEVDWPTNLTAGRSR